MLAHVDMYACRTGSSYNPTSGIIHWLLLCLPVGGL
ncbi:hypothetical protein SLEP1_g17552 [Rubroshorea leprosula]|uniref:Uncharacterized protein n=1 Tax=Rubroshorea leprosula TaxID=152421 RepID=A0AAV5J3W2_9ROSI|nr:hypothetical protein SLEP1_g17552 [Rubroshorea leprosula]